MVAITIKRELKDLESDSREIKPFPYGIVATMQCKICCVSSWSFCLIFAAYHSLFQSGLIPYICGNSEHR